MRHFYFSVDYEIKYTNPDVRMVTLSLNKQYEGVVPSGGDPVSLTTIDTAADSKMLYAGVVSVVWAISMLSAIGTYMYQRAGKKQLVIEEEQTDATTEPVDSENLLAAQ